MDLKIPEMSCGHCKAAIEKSVLTLDPAAIMTFDLAQRYVSIRSALPLEALQTVIDQAGYQSEVLSD
jgi:copper chaperone